MSLVYCIGGRLVRAQLANSLLYPYNVKLYCVFVFYLRVMGNDALGWLERLQAATIHISASTVSKPFAVRFTRNYYYPRCIYQHATQLRSHASVPQVAGVPNKQHAQVHSNATAQIISVYFDMFINTKNMLLEL